MPKAKIKPALAIAAIETASELPADQSGESASDTTTETTDNAATDKATQRNAAHLAANKLFSQLDPADSKPIKAMLAFKAYRAQLGCIRGSNASTRQAAMLAVACLASGNILPAMPPRDATASDADYIKACKAVAITFPRRFSVNAIEFAAENGCTADCVGTGIAAYSEKTESFTVNAIQAARIESLLSAKKLSAFAV